MKKKPILIVLLFILLMLSCNTLTEVADSPVVDETLIPEPVQATESADEALVEPTMAVSEISPTVENGFKLEALADGRQKFINNGFGYQFEISEDWVGIVFEDGQTFSEALTNLDIGSQEFQELMSLSAPVIAEGMHFIAYYFGDGAESMVTNANVLDFDDPMMAALGLQGLLDVNVASVEQMLPGTEILDSGIAENTNGFTYGYAEMRTPGDLFGFPEDVDLSQTMVIWTSDSSATFMTFSTLYSLADENYFDQIEQILDSLETLD